MIRVGTDTGEGMKRTSELLIEFKHLSTKGSEFRTEEPLKDYRQWVLDGVIARAKKNGVI